MKIISLEEFVADEKPAIYSHWVEQDPMDFRMEVQIPNLQLKTSGINDLAWWALRPLSNDLIGLADVDPSEIDKITDFIYDHTPTLPYDPAAHRDMKIHGDKNVLVFEDADIEKFLEIMISHFPEHAQRVFDKVKNNG